MIVLGKDIWGSDYLEVETIYMHEANEDIAIIKLKTKVDFTENISPICLPSSDIEFVAGEKCYLHF